MFQQEDFAEQFERKYSLFILMLQIIRFYNLWHGILHMPSYCVYRESDCFDLVSNCLKSSLASWGKGGESIIQ